MRHNLPLPPTASRLVPLPLQEGQACPCASLIAIFTIREETLGRCKSNLMSRDNPSTATRSPSLYTREADPCAALIFCFTIREKTLERCKIESSCTKIRLPCVKGAGSPQARLRDCTGQKDSFYGLSTNRTPRSNPWGFRLPFKFNRISFGNTFYVIIEAFPKLRFCGTDRIDLSVF